MNNPERSAYADKFLLVLCLERFWPAHGGVEAYTYEIARWFQRHGGSVVVITAVRDNHSLREALLRSAGSYFEETVGPGQVRVFTAGLGPVARQWFRSITDGENVAHRLLRSQYYRTRWLVAQETSRLLARDLKRVGLVGDVTNVVLHAMGPWELSLAADRLFPNAVRVATPFIHPEHWGEDAFSQRWFRSRDALIALGEEDAKACRATGISSDRVSVVPLFGPDSIEYLVRREDRHAVVFLGVARPYKGVELFIESARLLRSVATDIEFVWAGSIPSESEALIRSARDAGVTVVGAVGETEKRQLLSRAVCLCLPSATEITPFSFLEAWAEGTPVVTTDIPYLREFVGQGGELVPRQALAIADAIRRLAAHPELAEYRAQQGRKLLAERHDRSAVGQRLESVYRQAITRRRRSRLSD